jgi:outer membrane receptor protein involved in Fe transport
MTNSDKVTIGRGLRMAGPAMLMASTMLTGASSAFAADTAPVLDEVVVTAQKRSEDVQRVPVSLQVLGTQKLEQLHVTGLNDVIQFLPSVAIKTAGPGFTNVYMRGVNSGGDGNHSGSQPSVGIYLDEQPVTTIQGSLDVHMYDMARVEALAGPQGTLYGASSQAGTIRIITNKPDSTAFKAGYDLQVDQFDQGGAGYVGEGFVNMPINDKVAVRLVGWKQHEGGYIDNVPGTVTFPTSGATSNNAKLVEDDYNDVDTFGARAALRIELNDNWTISPTLMGQDQRSNGSFSFDPQAGDLKLSHYNPEKTKDRWGQAALMIEGKIGDFDLVYSGAYLKRTVHTQSDYTDYAYFYDTLFGSGAYFTNDAGVPTNPSQYIRGRDGFTKQSHELRLTSPAGNRLRYVAGLFFQEQQHHIEQRYMVNSLGADIEVPGWPDTIWLTQQERTDKDYAVFGEVTYDLTDKLILTGGIRAFKSDNSLKGFFGYGSGFSSKTGVAACFAPASVDNSPCTNLNKSTKENDFTHKLNLTYQIDNDHMVYATWSTGYRPGGINRRGTLPPYASDFLTNYELGWKTRWFDNSVRFNGAVFNEDWADFQYSFLGANGLTEIRNAGQARIRGIETDLTWVPAEGLTLSGGAGYFDAKLTENFCKDLVGGKPVINCATPAAPSGTRLPITPKVKLNVTARYVWTMGAYDAHVQGTALYQSSATSDLRVADRAVLGDFPSYVQADFAAGLERDNWSIEAFLRNAFDERGEIGRTTQCAVSVCGGRPYTIPTKPRLIGVKFGQKF